MVRKSTTLAAIIAALLWAPPPGLAADYPTRPVTLMVAFTPGGPSDVLARILGKKLEQILGQPFIIENRPGAGGNVAAEAVARAAGIAQISAPRPIASRVVFITVVLPCTTGPNAIIGRLERGSHPPAVIEMPRSGGHSPRMRRIILAAPGMLC